MSGYPIGALTQINNGLAPDDGSGDSLRAGAEVINNNFNVTRMVVNSQAAVDEIMLEGNGLVVNTGSGASLLGGSQTLNANSAALAQAVNNLAASQAAGTISYLTLAAMNADLTPADGVVAYVTNDSTVSNNGWYRKNGASGAGSWGATVNPVSNALTVALGNPAGFEQAGAGSVVRTYNAKSAERFTPEDKGAIGDGVTDDTAAVQAIINAAGVGGCITLNNAKKYLCGPLTLLDYQTIRGASYVKGSGGGSSAPASLYFKNLTGSQVAVTCGKGNVFDNVSIQGPGRTVGTTVGIVSGSAAAPSYVTGTKFEIQGFAVAKALSYSFYSSFTQCEFRQNGIVAKLDKVYNLDYVSCHFQMYDSVANTGGAGILATSSVTGLRIFGGSIEGWAGNYALKLSAPVNSVSFFGTYFEPSPGMAGTETAIDLTAASFSVFNAEGCTFYAYNCASFINGVGASRLIVNSRGNQINSLTASSPLSTPVIYNLDSNPGLACEANIEGDEVSNLTKGVYIAPAGVLSGSGFPNYNVKVPAQLTGTAAASYNLVGRPTAFYPLTAAPASPLPSGIHYANTGFWNPCGDSFGTSYFAVYDAAAAKWRHLSSRIYYGPAAPTTGTWAAGDLFINTSLTAGGNTGWACIGGGTPGTWVATGRLSLWTSITTTSTLAAYGSDGMGDASAGAITISLPATPVANEMHTVKKIDSSANAVTVSGNGKNIDGAGTAVLAAQWSSLTVQYSNFLGRWLVVAKV